MFEPFDVQIEMEFRTVGFGGGWKTRDPGEKPSEQGGGHFSQLIINHKVNKVNRIEIQRPTFSMKQSLLTVYYRWPDWSDLTRECERNCAKLNIVPPE